MHVNQSGERQMSLPDSFHVRKVTLFSTFALPPYQNMGIDEWMAQEALNHPGEFYARLYCWSPGGITIGFHQEIERALLPEKIENTPVIRRLTGGRAVYHDPSELTYSFAWCQELEPSARKEFDTTIRQILEMFVAGQGEAATPVALSDPDDRSPLKSIKSPCFASKSRDELLDPTGRKLVARAKRELGRLHFEHGSIKLLGVAGHSAIPGLMDMNSLPAQQSDHFEHACILFRHAVQTRMAVINAIPVSLKHTPDLLLKATSQIEMVEFLPLGNRQLTAEPVHIR
jgi:lipoate-protein ligase A